MEGGKIWYVRPRAGAVMDVGEMLGYMVTLLREGRGRGGRGGFVGN